MASNTGDQRAFQLELEFSDPYKKTALFNQKGRVFFGLWNPPVIKLDGDEERITIPLGMEGSLDILSFEVYGDRKFWRAIAQANKIDFPKEEVKAGDVLVIPKPSRVRAAYQISGGRPGVTQ